MAIFHSKPLNCQRGIALLWQAEMPKLNFLALDSSWDAMDILSNFSFQAWLAVGFQGLWLLDDDTASYGFRVPCLASWPWPRIQDHEVDVIYLEVTRSKCRFLTRWTHPFRCGWVFGCGMAVPCLAGYVLGR